MRRIESDMNVVKWNSGTMAEDSAEASHDIIDRFGTIVSKAPKSTFGVLMLATILMFGAMTGSLPFQEKSFNDNITTDIDQYIPEGTDEKRILDVVRENWATKIVIIYTKTGNAFDTNCPVNVTDRDVLEEISSVEGDDIFPGSNFARGDSGEYDWIEYILSLPALIKEVNSSTPRMVNVLEEEMATEMEGLFGSSVNFTEDDPYVEEQGKYAIPENQEQVDQILAQIPDDVLTGFCADTNDDGIWDTTYSMMGAIETTPDEEERDFIDHVIETRRTARSDDDIDPYFDDPNGPHHTWMIQTGLIAIMIDITEAVNDDLARTMPLAAGLVLAVMIFAHVFPGMRLEAGDGTGISTIRWALRLLKVFISRLMKVLSIAGLPLVCTIIWTFGIMAMTNLEQSPLIIAAMPMLIGLSVDYSLHVSNRITEFMEEGYTIREGIRRTFHTTGIAVLLSAVTTIIGFAALFVAPLNPIRMLGLMLIVGIASAFILSLTMVPCIVLIFHYKKPEMEIWERIAKVPIKHRWHIIGVVFIITLISLANLSVMTKTEEERDEDPETMGIKSLDAIIEFGEIWSEGSMSLVVLEPNNEAKQNQYLSDGALNDTEFLDQINWLEENFTSIEDEVDVEDVSAMTIVDMFKSVALNISWTTVEGHIPDYIPGPIQDLINPITDPITGEVSQYYSVISYWDFIHMSDDPDFQRRALRIFYNSLTQEARDMLMTPDYSMTLCMIRYPYVGTGLGEQIIDNINEDAHNANNLVWEEDGETKYATLHASKATSGQALSLTINEAIMDTQKQTLLLSLFFVFIALSVVFFHGSKKSELGLRIKEGVRYAVITMIPVASVVAWQPLIMASVSSFEGGASLNFMTAMISSVVIGAGIDFGVHITERIREEGETLEGIQRAVQHTGQSIMEANLTTVAALTGGLAVAWFRGFFSVLLLLLLYSMFAGMILLPSVYAVLAERRERKGKGTSGLKDAFGKPFPGDDGTQERGSFRDEDVTTAELIEDAVEDSDDIGEFGDQDVEWEIGD